MLAYKGFERGLICRGYQFMMGKNTTAASGGFAIARGADPVACGAKGDILAFAKEDGKTGRVIRIALTAVDGRQIRPGIWYDTDFNERGSTK